MSLSREQFVELAAIACREVLATGKVVLVDLSSAADFCLGQIVSAAYSAAQKTGRARELSISFRSDRWELRVMPRSAMEQQKAASRKAFRERAKRAADAKRYKSKALASRLMRHRQESDSQFEQWNFAAFAMDAFGLPECDVPYEISPDAFGPGCEQ